MGKFIQHDVHYIFRDASGTIIHQRTVDISSTDGVVNYSLGASIELHDADNGVRAMGVINDVKYNPQVDSNDNLSQRIIVYCTQSTTGPFP